MQSTYTRAYRPLSWTAKIFILLIPVLIITAFISFFTDIFIVLLLCLLFALVLNPVVDLTQSFGISRTLSILIVYAVITVILYGASTMVIPSIISQSDEIQKSYKEFQVSEKIKDVEKWLEKSIPFVKKGDITKELETMFKSSFTKVEDLITGVLSTVIFIIAIPVVTFFILRDRQQLKNGLISLVPNRYFEMTINIVAKIEHQLSLYVRGWLLDALFLGVMTFIGLRILGINSAVIIGVLAGL
ncbi:MAG TPA: AI-2E family transporter, partial [Ignavibacteria bacterium]